MPRLRLGVVLPLPSPVSYEVDGLRRACGDGMLGRVPPHLTLVPPVNVREDELEMALAVVRRAAAKPGRPLEFELGPVETFAPASPTVYLGVHGPDDAVQRLRRLRDAVFQPPLARSLTWPFTPHVTVADEVDRARIPAMVAALSSYRITVTFDRVVVLQEGPGRVWTAIAVAPLG